MQWPQDVIRNCLDFLITLGDGKGGLFYTLDTDMKPSFYTLHTVDRGAQELYRSNYFATDPLQARYYLKSGQNIVSLDHVPAHLKRQSEVFRNEFLIPAGYNHTLELFIRCNSKIIAGISLQRHKDDLPFTEHELNIIAKARNFIEFRLLHQNPAILLQHENNGEHLTLREEQILALLCRGLTYQTIALELNIASSTVKTHIQNIYGKLGVANRNELFVRLLEQRRDTH